MIPLSKVNVTPRFVGVIGEIGDDKHAGDRGLCSSPWDGNGPRMSASDRPAGPAAGSAFARRASAAAACVPRLPDPGEPPASTRPGRRTNGRAPRRRGRARPRVLRGLIMDTSVA